MFEMRNDHLSSSLHLYRKLSNSFPFWAWWFSFWTPTKDHFPYWRASVKKWNFEDYERSWRWLLSKGILRKVWILKRQRRRTRVKMIPHVIWNDLWFDHHEIQFESIYHFFRNHEPQPTLRTWKVHFDRTWILRLKRFLKIHRTIKEKRKWLRKKKNMTLGWKPKRAV